MRPPQPPAPSYWVPGRERMPTTQPAILSLPLQLESSLTPVFQILLTISTSLVPATIVYLPRSLLWLLD